MDYDQHKLVGVARQSKQNAYQPYSEYAVGACLLTEDGDFYKGVNIENITLDMCGHISNSTEAHHFSGG